MILRCLSAIYVEKMSFFLRAVTDVSGFCFCCHCTLGEKAHTDDDDDDGDNNNIIMAVSRQYIKLRKRLYFRRFKRDLRADIFTVFGKN